MVLKQDTALMVHSDRLSAFDRAVGLVPYKGMILAAISQFWFKFLAQQVPNHYLGSPHPRVLHIKKLKTIKIEVVVRGYLAGSLLRAYQEGTRRIYGIQLPDHMQPYDAFPQPILTPTTKAEVYEHDEETSPDQLIAKGVVSAAQWKQISNLALKLFALGQELFLSKGWVLADTKYEFGTDSSGQIFLIDEVHTPDSSRLWQLTEAGAPPRMFDKELIRTYLQSKGFSGHGEVPKVPAILYVNLTEKYLEVAESLLGRSLSVDQETNLIPPDLLA
jgi:phosphoribosylaminoimidazole-succinocarboxamide synthase